jgi:GMP synthase (glutamine-hydrolysing)
MNVDREDRHAWLPEEKRLIRDLVERDRPVLGVCLGSQLLAEAAGARVGPLPGGAEIGWHEVDLLPAAAGDPVLGGLPAPMLAFEWHGYGVLETPAGMTELARNGAGLQAYRLGAAPAWGIQFHAEVDASTVAKWVDDDARNEGLDPVEMNEQIGRELPRWNELGRRLCGAFIEAASR